MQNNVYEIKLAGHKLRYSFRLDDSSDYFRGFLRPCPGSDWDIRLSEDRLLEARQQYHPSFPDAYVEFRAVRLPSSLFLMERGCCLFHATAFLYQGGAWLLTAPSGTGKTTQYLNWQRRFPGEIQMICGDMPVLELRGDEVWVHPSPWNGKENMGGWRSAPLAGVIFLEQGSEDRILEISARERIEAGFEQLVGRPETEGQARAVCAILDAAFQKSRVCRFVNRGDLQSTELLRAWIREEEQNNGTV